jgi:hypothetical protein
MRIPIFLAAIFVSTIKAERTQPFDDKYPQLDTVQILMSAVFLLQHFLGLLGHSLLIYVSFFNRKPGFKNNNFEILVITMDFAAGFYFSDII